jgi:membrane-associated phospholipid phosphatase
MASPRLDRLALAWTIGIVAIVFCYVWVDRPVAFFVHRHHVAAFQPFKWLTYPPPWVQAWSPLFLTLLALRRLSGPLTRCQVALAVALLSLIVADQFRTSLGDVFGRYWPETWFNNNPSLIGTGTYGFHPFQHGDDVGSFPSGHAARILAFVTVWWFMIPRTRPLCVIVALPMLVSLVAMNYHFVSDVIAGSLIGATVAIAAVSIAARCLTSSTARSGEL